MIDETVFRNMVSDSRMVTPNKLEQLIDPRVKTNIILKHLNKECKKEEIAPLQQLTKISFLCKMMYSRQFLSWENLLRSIPCVRVWQWKMTFSPGLQNQRKVLPPITEYKTIDKKCTGQPSRVFFWLRY